MKPKLKNLIQALTYQLEGMYEAEKKLLKFLPRLINSAKSTTLKSELKAYAESTADKRTKLKRAFSYLLSGPYKRKNTVIVALIDEARKVKKIVNSPALSDVLLIASLQDLMHYKIAAYGSAHALAGQLELQTVNDLLTEILQWEKNTNHALSKLAVDEINRKAKDKKIPAL